MVGAERGEVNQAMEEVIGSGGNSGTVHGREKLEWAN
jgi:hypothetical protein